METMINVFFNPLLANGDINGVACGLYLFSILFIIFGFIEKRLDK